MLPVSAPRPASTSIVDRRAFRAFELDRAMLYFRPDTGLNVRVSNEHTSAMQRRAPRVAMFGITNACNLACTFCSRDRTRESLWTVESAAATLRDLAAAGTLEVAFGGGEPFAFRGFAELVEELHRTTPLALNVTTNGTLVRRDTWSRFRGRFGQVRVSMYDDGLWRAGCEVHAAHGQRWGANLIVEPRTLDRLPTILAELAAMQCHDVSLLAYVGPDGKRHLDYAERARLASMIDDAPLACRLSVCFGDRVPSRRLFDGIDGSGDCGAGVDFVSITPDQRVQGCSFQDGGLPGATAAEVLAAWHRGRAQLTEPSARDGCARRLAFARARGATETKRALLPPIAIWQAFSGNNSGECILVAKFETVRDAEAYLAELLPNWKPAEPEPQAWRELFVAEGVSFASEDRPLSEAQWPGPETPRELVAIGRTVLAAHYDAGDAFPELRALAWKRGAFVLPGGIHLHDKCTLLAAVRARDARDVTALATAPPHPAARIYVHGDVVLITLSDDGARELASLRDLMCDYAQDRPYAVELFEGAIPEEDFVARKQRLGSETALRPRLGISYWGAESEERARRFARTMPAEQVTVAGSYLLLDGLERRKRLAVLAYRNGAAVSALDGLVVRVRGHFWHMQPPRTKGSKTERLVIDAAAIEAALRASLPTHRALEVTTADDYRQGVSVEVGADDPQTVLAALDACAQSIGCRLNVGVEDLDPLDLAIRRLLADVRA